MLVIIKIKQKLHNNHDLMNISIDLLATKYKSIMFKLSHKTTGAVGLLSSQTFTNCCHIRIGCSTVVNMTLSQLFAIKFKMNFYFVFVIKWVYEKHKLLQFLFAFTVSQLF